MNDFRLMVFIAVARNLSFTKAAAELNVSQPAISKHITEIENSYGVQLFERSKNRVDLTKNGLIFLKLAQEIHAKYKELEFEMNIVSHNQTGELVVGASTTIAQYLLPSVISKFMERFPDVKMSLISGNSQYIESLIADNRVDLGLVEGAFHKKEFHYSVFSQDELVLVCSPRNKVEEISIERLKTIPLVLREEGSGTLEVIKKSLRSHNLSILDLNVIIQLGSSEAIKRYVMGGESYAIVSIVAVLDELKRGDLQIVDIEGLSFERQFSFVSQIGGKNRLADKFASFVQNMADLKLL